MRNTTDIEYEVARVFASDVKDHQMIVRLDQGLHKHLTFRRRTDSWYCWFDLIATPGALVITGDHGGHIFRRQPDMFAFFRNNVRNNPDRPHRINASYWAEKTADGGRSVQVYSEDVLRQLLDEHLREEIARRDAVQQELDEENERQLEEWVEDLRAEGVAQGDPDYPPPTPERAEDWPELIEARKLVEESTETIQDFDDDGLLSFQDGARDLLKELERIGLVSDTWEWDLTDWDFHFLWCLNAIAWGIQQYDRAVRDGRHKVRAPLVPWDDPHATTPPVAPKPPVAKPEPPVKVTVRMSTVETTEAL